MVRFRVALQSLQFEKPEAAADCRSANKIAFLAALLNAVEANINALARHKFMVLLNFRGHRIFFITYFLCGIQI